MVWENTAINSAKLKSDSGKPDSGYEKNSLIDFSEFYFPYESDMI